MINVHSVKCSLALLGLAMVFGAVGVPLLVAAPWLALLIPWFILELFQDSPKGAFIPLGITVVTVAGAFWGTVPTAVISCVIVLVPTVLLKLNGVTEAKIRLFLIVTATVIALTKVLVRGRRDHLLDLHELSFIGITSLSGLLSGWSFFHVIRYPLERLVDTLGPRPLANRDSR